MKKILQSVLKRMASDVLKEYNPLVIGVTGSMGKTSTKEAIFAVLSQKFRVRQNIKNYNNEIGVPLTILGQESGGRSPEKWLLSLGRGAKLTLVRSEYPEVLILEMGVDKPGDMKYLMSFINPAGGVVTGIGDVPVHIEFFKSPVQVAREKARLIEYLRSDDFVALNYDDKMVRLMQNKTKAKVWTYGFDRGARVRATNYETDIKINPSLSGISFKIEYDGKTVPFRKEGFFGRHQVYPLLAASSVGLAMGMNLIEVSEGLKNYAPPAGRMRLLEGIKKTWLIDDSYNASPTATLCALETLEQFKDRKRIAVLGDMLELGEFTEQVHKEVGEKAAQSADIFFAVGQRMAFAAEAAKNKLGKKNKNKVFWFETADAARLPLQMTIRENDIVLIKGSQSMRMERIVEEVMARPELASELLVRQNKEWKIK